MPGKPKSSWWRGFWITTTRRGERSTRTSRLKLEELETRLAPAFDLTITVGELPAATNPYGITSLDNQIYASSYGTVGGTPSQFAWDASGNVTVHGGPLPVGPKLATALPSGGIGAGGQSFFKLASIADAALVKVGMRASGGLANGGNVMPAFAIVIGVDEATGVIKVNGNLVADVDGGDVQFFNTLGDQLIPRTGITLHLPTAQDLSSVRFIFTIGGHGWLSVDAGGGVAAPTVHDDPYYQAITWDFAEYTLNTSGGAASKFTLNQSMIDQFGFPVQLSVAPGISGQPDEAGVFISHDQTITDWNTFIGQAPADAKVVFGDLSTVQGANKRIVSPADRVNLPNLPATLPTYFDSQIVAFFNTYDQAINAGAKFTMFSVPGAGGTGKGTTAANQTNLHELEGSVLTLSLTGTAATTTPGGGGVNEVQTLTFTPAVGKAFVLTFMGKSTGPLAHDVSAATLQAALESLSGIGTGNVSVTGANGSFTVTFQGALANTNVDPIAFATPSNQRVLQLTDVTAGSLVIGRGDVYNVYEPFWQTNGYATKPSGYPYASVPVQAPAWIIASGRQTESPGQMVFGGDGVFADNLTQTPLLNGNQQTLLGAIENQIVTALNRGIVLNPYQDWLYSSQFIKTPAGGGVVISGSGTTLTLPSGVFLPQVVPGVGVVSGAMTAIVSTVSADGLTVTLTNSTFTDGTYGDIVFTYAQLPNPFYKNSSANLNPDKIWNYYTQYFHQDTVVKDGLAYAYAYDDQGSFSSTIAAGVPGITAPTGAKIILGTVKPATTFETSNWVDYATNSGWSKQLVGDFDDDGRDDIANFHPSNGTWWVSLALPTGGFATTLWADYATNSGWGSQLVGDFNGDSRDDLANFHPGNGTWFVSLSNGAGFDTQLWSDFATNSGWASQVVGDFNGDGRDDLANFHPGNGTWWVSLSNGAGFDTQLWSDFATNSGWASQVVGDFNGDGRADLANFHPGNGTWWVSLALPGGGFDTTLWADYATNSGWTAQRVGDFNMDGYDDLANFHPANGTWWVSLSDAANGNLTFLPPQLWADYGTNSGWTAQLVGDFTGDGLDDIANFHPSNGTWWVSAADGTQFSTTLWADYGTNSGWTAQLVGNFNGDAHEDIANFHPSNGTWWVSLAAAPAGLLTLDVAAVSRAADALALTQAQLNVTVAQAFSIFANLGVNATHFGQLTFAISDFAGRALGQASGKTITIDSDAAGHGWSLADVVDADNVDLLSVVLHELGHALSLEHGDAAFMAESIGLGERRLPTAEELDALISSFSFMT